MLCWIPQEFDQPGPRLVTKRRRILYILAAIVAVIIMVTLVLFGLRNYIWSMGSAENEDEETPYTTVSLYVPWFAINAISPLYFPHFHFMQNCKSMINDIMYYVHCLVHPFPLTIRLQDSSSELNARQMSSRCSRIWRKKYCKTLLQR